MPLRELIDTIDDRGLALDGLVLFNPRHYFSNDRARALTGDEGVGSEEILPPGVRSSEAEALEGAMIDGATIQGNRGQRLMPADVSDDYVRDTGWVAIPRSVWNEIEPLQEGGAMRGYGVLKNKASRLILGLGNISWLMFQVGANAMLTAMAIGPIKAVTHFRSGTTWFARLPEHEQEALLPILNIEPALYDARKRHLGADAINSRVVSQYHAFRKSDIGNWLKDKNFLSKLMDAAFEIDRAQTTAFRKAVFYSDIKKEAMQNFADHGAEAYRLQDRFVDRVIGGKNMDEQIKGLLQNRKAVEQHAQSVTDMLGDYTTFTRAERRYFQRHIMFYGFLRHSVQLTLLTMPQRHPIMLGLLARAALLSDKEVRELLGIDEIPWYMAGFWFEKDGQKMVMNLNRMSFFGNSIFEMRGGFNPMQLVGVLPPALSMTLSSATGYNFFRGENLRVSGENRYEAFQRGTAGVGGVAGGLSIPDRLFTLVRQMEGLVPPLRYTREILHKGPQGDDSTLLLNFLRSGETEYEREPSASQIKRQVRREGERGILPLLLEEVLAGPRPVYKDEIEYLREREKLQKERVKKQRKKSGSSSGSGGYNYGGSSSSGGYKYGGAQQQRRVQLRG